MQAANSAILSKLECAGLSVLASVAALLARIQKETSAACQCM